MTFYRRIRPFKIEVLRRYLIERSGQDVVVRPWAGSYDAIVAQLWLMPSHWTDRPPEPPSAE
ncbi:MAG: hypothetical protein HY320_06390 [Armatimonadetes bacterium]|nr:hypothetical protein [Armatimonadota bacterium]